jgi:hypothetical protein
MVRNKPLSRETYLCSLYSEELDYINKIMEIQDYYYLNLRKIVILIDRDFPNFKTLNDKKIGDLISIYEKAGWKIDLKEIKLKTEQLFILY